MTGLWHCVTLAVVLMCVCLWGSATADPVGAAKVRERIVRKQKPPNPTANPVDRIPVGRPIDMSMLRGKWYLLNLASKCPYQLRPGSRAEATFIDLTPPEGPGSSMSVSTKTRFNHDCWEIIQQYYPTPTQGRYLLKGKKDSESDTDVIIMEVDNAYAFILYQRKGMVTLKLYGRSTINLSEPMLAKFERLAQEYNMSLAYLFPFPTFGKSTSSLPVRRNYINIFILADMWVNYQTIQQEILQIKSWRNMCHV
ncbi:Complement component C8 gamma chain [Merluccius polli]|uniref:Complement component C8 gamma chain n=1 Tax=Merluccius polli TaxID=89951 RepID=A0AA47M7G7_MERPO|nr:Complement component C8 gamma chain [Merluccius polli]